MYGSTSYSNLLQEQEDIDSLSTPSGGMSNFTLQNDDVFVNTIKLVKIMENTAQTLRMQLKDTQTYAELNAIKKRPRKISVRFSENIFIITVIWQVLCVALLEMIDLFEIRTEKQQSSYYFGEIAVMVVFQFTNLCFSVVLKVKLTKQYMHHTATMKFLLQSYLSSLFLFAGIYTFIARVLPYSFSEVRGKHGDHFFALELYSQLLFTSISTGTLCGAASVVAVHWLPELVMGFQMMLSFIYFGSIISQVINPTLKNIKTFDGLTVTIEK